MGRLTKAGFAAAKSELGLKGKLTRKQVQRVFKRAIKKLGRTERRVSKKGKVYYTKPKTKKVKRNMAKKRKRGGKSLQRTVFKWLRIGALLAPAAWDASQPVDAKEKIARGVKHYTGFNLVDGKWRWQDLAVGWLPFLATCGVTYGIPKIVGIIRRI